MRSRPAWGAWIEIQLLFDEVKKQWLVAPRMGRVD